MEPGWGLEPGFLGTRGLVGVTPVVVVLLLEVVVVAVVVIGLEREIPGGPIAGADRPGVPGDDNPGGPTVVAGIRRGEGDVGSVVDDGGLGVDGVRTGSTSGVESDMVSESRSGRLSMVGGRIAMKEEMVFDANTSSG